MPIQYKLFFFLFLLVNLVSSQNQESGWLKGKIVSVNNELEGINIINLNTDYSTNSQKNGYFEVKASVGDTLLFSGVQFEKIKIKVAKEDFLKETYFVKLQILVNQLDEVTVNKFGNINAVSLGIVSKNQKKYTPAERKLYTATGGRNEYGTNTKISFDAILNAISGRTTMLKKALVLEKKEMVMQKITSWFIDVYFIESLKIPAEYVGGFKYYIVENDKLVAAVNAKNKTLTSFIMTQLATDYLNLLNGK